MKGGEILKYFVLVRFEKDGKWQELTREFCDYERAHEYAQYEYGRDADNITVCLYELKECWN